MVYIFKIFYIQISWWHITPQVQYAVFRAPIIIIGTLIWIEIGTQNNSTCFMRIEVADKAMTDVNRRRICDTLSDQQNEAQVYCSTISIHCVSSLISGYFAYKSFPNKKLGQGQFSTGRAIMLSLLRDRNGSACKSLTVNVFLSHQETIVCRKNSRGKPSRRRYPIL